MEPEADNLDRRTCTVIYQEDENHGSEQGGECDILFAKWDRSDGLSLFMNPAWRDIVSPARLKYINDLFEDFRERQYFDPEGLFQQLCSLDVGPVRTHEVRHLQAESQLCLPPNFVRFI